MTHNHFDHSHRPPEKVAASLICHKRLPFSFSKSADFVYHLLYKAPISLTLKQSQGLADKQEAEKMGWSPRHGFDHFHNPKPSMGSREPDLCLLMEMSPLLSFDNTTKGGMKGPEGKEGDEGGKLKKEKTVTDSRERRREKRTSVYKKRSRRLGIWRINTSRRSIS